MAMSKARKWLAFDIETAKEVPGDDFNWRQYRPLGITCLATLSSDEDQPRLWMSRAPNGTPAPQMTMSDLHEVIRYLCLQTEEQATLVSWNGLAFDFDVLAEESGLLAECRRLAEEHVDMMFHVFCEKGFPVALKNAAAGMNLAGKLKGVEGIDAPRLWREGAFETVLEYVAQDVRTTLAVAQEADCRRQFAWRTQRGTVSTLPLPSGWHSVAAAQRLPLPETSWMDRPLSREHFTGWMEGPPPPRGIGRSPTDTARVKRPR